MSKGIILAARPMGDDVPFEEFPTVIAAGLTDVQADRVATALREAFLPGACAAVEVEAGVPGPLTAVVVDLADTVDVGDHLELVSSLYKKHAGA